MTVADSRRTSGDFDVPSRRDDSPRRPSRGTSPPIPSAQKPKPTLDVVDLLLMSAFESNTVTLPRPVAEVAGGDLLDAIVADHLTRANEPAAPTPDATLPPEPAPSATLDVDSTGLLQQEIDALLADNPISETPSLSTEAAPLSTDELDALLATAPPTDTSPDTTMLGNFVADESEAKLLEAEAALANELESMQADLTPSPAITAPAPDTTPPAASTPALDTTHVAESPPAFTFPTIDPQPIVEVLPPAGLSSTRPRFKPTRIAAMVADIALVAAQIADMPFRWIDDMDKNLFGAAAAILFLSGCALMLAAKYMGAR